MKAYLEIKRQQLPNYEANGLWKTIHKSAREHGYRSAVWYGLVRLKDHCLNFWSRTCPWNKARIMMQRWRGVNIGKHVHWGTEITVDAPYPYFVKVEEGASLAGNNLIITHNKPLAYHQECSESYVAPVVVHKHAWVAVGVTLLPGVEIGEGSIVSANSLVQKSIPHMVIAGGNPAKVIADISERLRSNYTPEEFESILEYRKKKFKM